MINPKLYPERKTEKNINSEHKPWKHFEEETDKTELNVLSNIPEVWSLSENQDLKKIARQKRPQEKD